MNYINNIIHLNKNCKWMKFWVRVFSALISKKTCTSVTKWDPLTLQLKVSMVMLDPCETWKTIKCWPSHPQKLETSKTNAQTVVLIRVRMVCKKISQLTWLHSNGLWRFLRSIFMDFKGNTLQYVCTNKH